ncbi:uncharacterized protein LOC115226583 [Octopus sinensis]|uniref:Uncharacterized protein LOC115226583 n=1 Tax=Octopus sinensis TaxID=2607531 RepID=A0A6P7TU69_9MOLL|nr:uncharacterized protein LOC115226583 [Octopus sinensis]XP_029653451.1 uncharacterized protein LOC115226583 [Octopus sinensis]
MEDHTRNVSSKLTPRKRAVTTTKSDGVYNKKCRYDAGECSRTEMPKKRPSCQSTKRQKRHKEDPKKREIIERRDVLDTNIYYTRFNAYEDKMNMLINSREKICNFLKSVGLDENVFIRCFAQRTNILLKDINKYDYSQDFVNFGKLELFLEHYINTNVLQDKYKTTEAPKIINKFRPLSPVVSREAKIDESGEDLSNITSNIIIIQGGIVTYSRHYMTICYVTRDGGRNDVRCPSSVTDLTRISEDTVLATLPFRKIILIINPSSFKIKTLQLGFMMVSYLQHSTFIGVEMFMKTIYLVDWDDNVITNKFDVKEIPADITVGVQYQLLISFANINRVVCYNLDGQQIFEVYTHSLDLPTNVTVYQNHFYVLQGHIIYKISGTGGVSQREIGTKCRNISVGTGAIFLTDYFGILRVVKTNKDFWPKLSYSRQLHTPKLNNHIYIEDPCNITNILPMSTSSILITYRNNKAILFTDTGGKIGPNYLNFPFFPSVFCRMNSDRFLVFYREIKRLQYITCPELNKGPLIQVHTDYIKICHIVSNKYLALITDENKTEVHIQLIKEDRVDIKIRISLEHDAVTIAATPINFVIVDVKKHKLVFYSTSGEALFEKYLQFYGCLHHIYSDNVYYYVLFKRESVVKCYNIYGDIKWQWKLPLTVHSHIAVFQGTIYVLDIEFHRVLLYRYHDWSGCCLPIKNPYIRNVNIRLKGNEYDKILIGKICNLPNGQLVVSDTSMIACCTFLMKGTLCPHCLCRLQLQIYVDGIVLE